MRHLKEGDTVVIIDSRMTDRTNQIGTIKSIDKDGLFPLTVLFKDADKEGDREEIFSETHIKLYKSQIIRDIIKDL